MNKYKLSLKFTEPEYYYLMDVSSILYDIELLHDYYILSIVDDYSEYNFSRFFYNRRGRPVKDVHKIILKRISITSPLEVTLIISSVSVLVLLLKDLFDVSTRALDRPLTTRKLELEIQKLMEETNGIALDNELKRLEFEDKLDARSGRIRGNLLRRLHDDQLKLDDFILENENNK